MKITFPPPSVRQSWVFLGALALVFPTFAWGNFSGSDLLQVPTDKWGFFKRGGADILAQNSRAEFLVASPEATNTAILYWQANEGGISQNWYLQVDVHLSMLPLQADSSVLTGLYVGNTDLDKTEQAVGLNIIRTTAYGTYESGLQVSDDRGIVHVKPSTLTDATLRLHYDSTRKTITSSWNSGNGWQYFAPADVNRWGMKTTDRFYAFLAGVNQGPQASSLTLKSGSAFFTGFKAGNASPEIVVEQPAKREITTGVGKKNFGKVSSGIGKVSKTFVIRNSGTADLKGLKVTRTGANPADFKYGKLAKTTLRPGEFTTVAVSFSPKIKGPRKALIRISSNDPNERIFNIAVTGTGVK